jgi:hypothetical protein
MRNMATYANSRFLKAHCGSWLEDANHPKIFAMSSMISTDDMGVYRD